MPRGAKGMQNQPDMSDNEAPEPMAEAMAEAQAEKTNGGREVELSKRRPKKPVAGSTMGNRSGGMMGDFHSKRAKG